MSGPHAIVGKLMPKPYSFKVGPVGKPLTEHQVKPAVQCKSKHWAHKNQCQGVRGHQGPHWAYRPDGWLDQWQRKKDIKGPMDWASQMIPPDHKMYIHPKDMAAKRYQAFDHVRFKLDGKWTEWAFRYEKEANG